LEKGVLGLHNSLLNIRAKGAGVGNEKHDRGSRLEVGGKNLMLQ
jgi:hypothetical protein